MPKPTYEEVTDALAASMLIAQSFLRGVEVGAGRTEAYGRLSEHVGKIADVLLRALSDDFVAADLYKPTIAIDFDGVIHAYVSPWTTTNEIHDGPVEGAFAFIVAAQDAGFEVVIHTARANHQESIAIVREWLQKHGLAHDRVAQIHVTAHKVGAIVYIDDRGWRFDGTWPTLDELRALRQWNKPAPKESA